jgi:2-hydroxy-3-oxopropionate reductase
MPAAAHVVSDAAAVAQAAEAIIIMVPDTPDVEQVLFGAHGVAEGLAKGKLVIDMSSISPVATKELRGADRRRWVATGSMRRCRAAKSAPKGATLTIMCGGSDAAFARAEAAVRARWARTSPHVGTEPALGPGCARSVIRSSSR